MRLPRRTGDATNVTSVKTALDRRLGPQARLHVAERDLQDVFYGSDGTRTRDLRRDRPVRGSLRLTTMHAESLYSWGFSGFSRSDSAWLSEADFRRLLPVCCPGCTVKAKRVGRGSASYLNR